MSVCCSLCRKPAAVRLLHARMHLCAKHFEEYFERRVLWTIKGMRMLEQGERVAVAVSGGKDSLTLLFLLSKCSHYLGVELVALLIDEGIRGYRELKVEAARRYVKEWGVELKEVSFKERFGFTLDEAVEVLVKGSMKYKPCTVCGVLRRYLLNEAALELGADKLATAHNLDDEVQVFMMNVLQSNLVALAREGASARRTHEKLVPRVKPLYFVLEREVMAYALLHGIETPDVECPYIVYSTRHLIRRWLNRVAQEDARMKHRVLAFKSIVVKGVEPEEEFGTCKVCGMPSAGEVCRACQLREYLDGLLQLHPL